MMRCALVVLFSLALTVPSISCGPRERTTVEQDRTAVVRAVQAVSYKRTAAGAEDTVTIAQDGAVECSGKTFGKAQGTLSEFQLMRLARIFEGWDKLQDNYAGPKGSPDAPIIEIKFGQKTVTASEAAKNLPDPFIQARQRLEALPRELPATK